HAGLRANVARWSHTSVYPAPAFSRRRPGTSAEFDHAAETNFVESSVGRRRGSDAAPRAPPEQRHEAGESGERHADLRGRQHQVGLRRLPASTADIARDDQAGPTCARTRGTTCVANAARLAVMSLGFRPGGTPHVTRSVTPYARMNATSSVTQWFTS